MPAQGAHKTSLFLESTLPLSRGGIQKELKNQGNREKESSGSAPIHGTGQKDRLKKRAQTDETFPDHGRKRGIKTPVGLISLVRPEATHRVKMRPSSFQSPDKELTC